MFLDFRPASWVRLAFLAAHVWLGWALWTQHQHPISSGLKASVLAVATELVLVYAITAWLSLRGFPLYLDFF